MSPSAARPRRSKKSTAEKNQESSPPRQAAQHGSSTEAGFTKLQWRREPYQPPTNRQRVWLALAIVALLVWLVTLAWLVWDSV